MGNSSVAIVGLMKVGVATLFGGPIAGGTAAASGLVELAKPRLNEWAEARASIDGLALEIERWSRHQDYGSATIELGTERATDLLGRHGATLEEFVRLNVDPDRVTRLVLERSSLLRNDLGFEAQAVCDETVSVFYRRLFRQMATDPTITALREVLNRLPTAPEVIAGDAARRSALEAESRADVLNYLDTLVE